MSLHHRSQIRLAAKLALQHCAHFDGLALRSAWASNVSLDALPLMALLTPQERVTHHTTHTTDREVDLIFLIRRTGGEDLEDQLDLDSLHAETTITAALRTQGFGVSLQSTEISIDQSGERRIGSLDLKFEVLLTAPEPLTL